MPAISNDWLVPLSAEFKKPYYREFQSELIGFLK